MQMQLYACGTKIWDNPTHRSTIVKDTATPTHQFHTMGISYHWSTIVKDQPHNDYECMYQP